jgi:hypothetical protein
MKITTLISSLALFSMVSVSAFAEVETCSVNVLVNLSFPQGGKETGYFHVTDQDFNNREDIFSEFQEKLSAKGYHVKAYRKGEKNQYILGLTSFLMKTKFGMSFESAGSLVLERQNDSEKEDRVAELTITKNEMYLKTSSRTAAKAQKSAFAVLIDKMPECSKE